MIDLHCHLLPGLDDGPATLEDALSLARAAAAAGTRTIVATPHIDGRWGVDPAAVHDAVERMRAALDEAYIELEVQPGGEIALMRLPGLSPAELTAVRLGGGPYMLLECPHRSAEASAFPSFVSRLLRRGERIVLAHPERSPAFMKGTQRLAALVGEGALCSITASSLLGRFGSRPRELSVELLRTGLAHNVASDAHEADRRGPELLAGLQAAERDVPGVLAQADWLTRLVPEAVLAGDDVLPLRPDLPEPSARRWWRRG